MKLILCGLLVISTMATDGLAQRGGDIADVRAERSNARAERNRNSSGSLNRTPAEKPLGADKSKPAKKEKTKKSDKPVKSPATPVTDGEVALHADGVVRVFNAERDRWEAVPPRSAPTLNTDREPKHDEVRRIDGELKQWDDVRKVWFSPSAAK